MNPSDIVLDRVSRIFQNNRVPVKALTDVTLRVPSGSFRTVAGASGSGKTTLLNLIGGLDVPTAGEIRIGPHRLNQMNAHELAHYRRHHVGFIFQGNNLISTLSAFENVEIPLILTGSTDRTTTVNAILDAVDLIDKKDSFPHLLSGGEQQRIAVARALVHRPALILADEPTANLDSKSGSGILKLLKRLSRRFHTTILFATHDQRIIDMSDHVVWLCDGRLA